MKVAYLKRDLRLKQMFVLLKSILQKPLLWCVGNGQGYIACSYRYVLRQLHFPKTMLILTHFAHPPELFMRVRHWKAYMPLKESDYVGYVYPSWIKQLQQFMPPTLMKEIEAKAHYLPLGVDMNFYSSNPYPKRQEKVIITMAYWHLRKGLHKLIQAMQYLPDWELLVAGTFKTETVPSDPHVAEQWNLPSQMSNFGYRNYCLKLARESKARIHFLGWLNQEEKKYWLHKASIFVLPTWIEACSIADLEAMACGCPILITDGGGSPDHVPKEQLIGRFITPKELAERIRGLDKGFGWVNQKIAWKHDIQFAGRLKQRFLNQVEEVKK